MKKKLPSNQKPKSAAQLAAKFNQEARRQGKYLEKNPLEAGSFQVVFRKEKPIKPNKL